MHLNIYVERLEIVSKIAVRLVVDVFHSLVSASSDSAANASSKRMPSNPV